MMHHESGDWSDARSRTRGVRQPVFVLAYRSRPVTTPTPAELDLLLRKAQQRNRLEGLTGLLIYDQGCFFQWLEGPKHGLLRVWDSIRRDARHTDFKILRQQSATARFFGGWDMRLARRTRGEIDRVLTAMEGPQELLTKLRVQPSVLPGGAWDHVFADAVLPRLRSVHDWGSSGLHHVRAGDLKSTAAIWHAHRGAGIELADVLQALDPGAAVRYVDALLDQGADLEPLFHEVFEPAARCLGGLWEDDRCDDFNVTLALGRLQVEVHRVSAALVHPKRIAQPGQAVLVAPQPGEAHGLNASMCAELFLRDGWDVSREYPADDQDLRKILHEQWFDVLDLSLSAALRRDQQLPAMRFTIRAARAASLNPALAVIVDGRSFFECPQAYLEVGADIGCSTSTATVSAAQVLLDAHDVTRLGNAEPTNRVQVNAG